MLMILRCSPDSLFGFKEPTCTSKGRGGKGERGEVPSAFYRVSTPMRHGTDAVRRRVLWKRRRVAPYRTMPDPV